MHSHGDLSRYFWFSFSDAGGVEEDIIKCLRHTYMGDFKLKGADLRKKGINRIGKVPTTFEMN